MEPFFCPVVVTFLASCHRVRLSTCTRLSPFIVLFLCCGDISLLRLDLGVSPFFFLSWLVRPRDAKKRHGVRLVLLQQSINSVKPELECTGHKGIAEESIKKDRVRRETTKPTTKPSSSCLLLQLPCNFGRFAKDLNHGQNRLLSRVGGGRLCCRLIPKKKRRDGGLRYHPSKKRRRASNQTRYASFFILLSSLCLFLLG